MSQPARTGENLIAGLRPIESLVNHRPERIKELWYAGELTGLRGQLVQAITRLGIAAHASSMKRIGERAGGLNHQGVLARVDPAGYVPWSSLLDDDALIVAVDQVTDPRNLGAILRAGEAIGITGALLTSNRCARLGPVVTRISAGASELLPVAMESNLKRALLFAKQQNFTIVGAGFGGQSPDLIDLSGPTILVIGAEGKGLRPSVSAVCDHIATIPMRGVTESLNAATAAGVLIYAACLQRIEPLSSD